MPLVGGSSNRFLTDDVIAREALRLLKNNLAVFPRVNRSVERRFGGRGSKIGDTISLKKPFRTLVASGRAFSNQPLVDESIPVVVDQQRHVDFTFYQDDRTLTINQFASRYLNSGMVALAHQVDLWVLDQIQDGGFYGSGTPGTAIDSDNFNDACAFMELVGVPMDGMVSSFCNPKDRANIAKDLKTVFNEGFVSDAVRRNHIGNLSGMETFSTAQMPVHTVAAHGGTPLVNGASQTGSSLITDGWTNSTLVLNKGDTFTIAGVYEVNPQTYQSTGRLQRFVATAAGTSGATTGPLTISISPAINDGTNTTVDGDGASVSLAAYQNVTAAPADNAAITVIGTASTSYLEALCFHRDAFMLAVVDLELPESAVVKQRVRDEDTGLSILMTAGYDIDNFQQKYRLDVLFGGKVVYPELIHRIKSATN